MRKTQTLCLPLKMIPYCFHLNCGAGSTEEKGNPIARFFKWIGSWKIGVKILVLVLILALMSGGVMAMTAIKEVEDAVKIMNAGAEIPDSYDLGITPVDGFINILLLGTDARQMSGDEPTRADMVMIASINVETHEVTLTSIYRDTYLKLGDTSTYDKITHAYFYGGPEMTIKTVNQALDLNIQNYAVVNFKVVADVVDAIGGIDINVEDYEIDEMNACIRENALVLTASDNTQYITSSRTPDSQRSPGSCIRKDEKRRRR